MGAGNDLWYTLSHGIVNEIYFPRPDLAQIRDFGLIVTDGRAFFSEEKRHTRHEVVLPRPGVPLVRLTNTCDRGRYVIVKTVFSHPDLPVLLQEVEFRATDGDADAYRLHALLAPHLGNRGWGNTAWCGAVAGTPGLFTERDGFALALVASEPWRARSAGYVGTSDGWQDLSKHFRMEWTYERAEDGNVALCGEVAPAERIVFALGFGRDAEEAAARATRALEEPARDRFVGGWTAVRAPLPPAPRHAPLWDTSVMVLLSHLDDTRGGAVASLSIPWGATRSDDDLGGYHLVWTRDMVEMAGGLLAAGAHESVRDMLAFLRRTQRRDGSWPQNMWLDGRPYWSGVQLDETALPILLADLALREGALHDAAGLRPMVRAAAGFLVRAGPATAQDRWEEDPGYTPFTLAAEIAALLAAAEWAERAGDAAVAAYLRETADAWNDSVERWTVAMDTPIARRFGVPGHYVRIVATDPAVDGRDDLGTVSLRNRTPSRATAPASGIVSVDCLALVRFGLRAADDPRIRDSVRVIDGLLRTELPAGPAWHRYNGDGYGEHEDGAPFDGTGIGRAWPLLTGERGHYELARGNTREAQRLLDAMAAFAHEGMLPEQVWDADDRPEAYLRRGRPTGSAMPLAWAHAEYLKLARSLEDGRVFDLPPQAAARYRDGPRPPAFAPWRPSHRVRRIRSGRALRVEVPRACTVHWSADGWRTTRDTTTRDSGLGLHVADLDVAGAPAGAAITFTLRWADGSWEGDNHTVGVGP
jgi:glucoamylase